MVSRRDFVVGSASVAIAASQLGFGGASSPRGTSQSGKTYVFPPDFLLGVASSAYQIEGAASEDGKGESIWDRWMRTPGQVKVKGDVAADHYHRVKEDVALLAQLGVRAYRFSISWPRIFPDGIGKPNAAGVRFYRTLVDELKRNNIKPLVTLYHWDLPQRLQDVGGWASPEIATHFERYASYVYTQFPDVPYWTTFNEPWVTCFMGYFLGSHPPGLRDLSTSLSCTYNVLRAHGRAVRAFRHSGIRGQIGITLDWPYTLPASERPEDVAAAARINESHHAWFARPIFNGEFPNEMWRWYEQHGAVMPSIDANELRTVSTRVDFLGLNYYRVDRVQHDPAGWWPYQTRDVGMADERNLRRWGNPDGLRQILKFLMHEYQTPIIITENGRALPDEVNENGEVIDDVRINYIYSHLAVCHEALSDGVKLAGYFNWSFLDDYEWGEFGRMGLVYVDFETQQRIIKRSGLWFREGIANGFKLPQYG